MEFQKYQHIERLGTVETENIEIGECWLFPKLDGSNGQVWVDENGKICCGSRNRELSLDNDNQGFMAWVLEQDNIREFFSNYQNLRLFGEWLCLSGDTVIRKTSGGRATNGTDMTLREMYKYLNTDIWEKLQYKTKKEGRDCYTKRPSWWKRNGMPSIFSLFLDDDIIKPNKIKNIIFTGNKPVYKITTRKGFSIKATDNHPFFTNCGFKPLKDIYIGECVATTALINLRRKTRTYGVGTNLILREQKAYRKKIGKCEKCGKDQSLEIHHKDGNHYNNSLENYIVLCSVCHRKQHAAEKKFNGFVYNYDFDKVVSIEYVGVEDCYDIQMCGGENEANFVANGFIVHNCPHTLRTYRKDAWNKFYVFDVVDKNGNYLPYEVYKTILDAYEIEYIPPICKIRNPTVERIVSQLEKNVYLIEDGKGAGEGIVIKNYNYRNKYGRQTWAKVVRNEFKAKHSKSQVTEVKEKIGVESAIVDKYVTESLVTKEFAKIENENGGWSSKMIPRLLNTVYYCLVKEESWNFIKENKNPKIDFKRLMTLSFQKTKELKPELF